MKKRTGILPLSALCLSLMLAGCSGRTEEAGSGAAESKQTGMTAEEAETGQDAPASETVNQGAADQTSEETAETISAEASGTLQERLEEAQKENEDVYAWLEITGTDLSFPVLQSPDNEYFYLTHNLEKEEADEGCIYTEYFNHKDFNDPNTVIYGRNVSGRFAGLHQFQDRDFFDQNRELTITLQDGTLTYQIFAAYTYDDRHLIKTYDFWDEQIYTMYLDDVFSRRAMDAFVDDSIEVTAQDKILTLSTGVTGEDESRYLVQAVRITE